MLGARGRDGVYSMVFQISNWPDWDSARQQHYEMQCLTATAHREQLAGPRTMHTGPTVQQITSRAKAWYVSFTYPGTIQIPLNQSSACG